MAEYHRIRCKGSGGTTWVMGDPWPKSEPFPIDPRTGKQAVPDANDPFLVGRIFFEPEVIDAVSIDGPVQKGADGKVVRDADGDPVHEQIFAGDSEKTHSFFEIWCVTPSLNAIVNKLINGQEPSAQELGEVVMKHPIMTVEVPASEVSAAYKVWDHGAAFRRLIAQMAKISKAAKDEEEEAEEEAKEARGAAAAQ